MFEKTYKELATKFLDKMQTATKEIKDKVDEKTPEDTKNLLKNNDTSVILFGDKIIGEVYNDKTDYVAYVEYGVNSSIYNYHKPKGSVFYQGFGARMFTRTLDNDVPKILKNFQ